MATDFLEQMAASSRQRADAAKRACGEADLLARALASPQPPPLRRDPAGFDLIAEMKLRSPAVGQLKTGDEDVGARVTAYARAGAAGVLVILRMLPRDELDALIRQAGNLGLFVLLEAFDEHDIELMHDIVEDHSTVELLAGVNCRDLATLQVVPRRLDELAHLLPTQVPRVAESGVATADDARRVASVGYELALVGSALMQGGDPGALAAAMLSAGRAARSKAA